MAAADRLERAGAALAAGSTDDGLVFAAATFNTWTGGEPGISADVLESCLVDALATDDLHRQGPAGGEAWVRTLLMALRDRL